MKTCDHGLSLLKTLNGRRNSWISLAFGVLSRERMVLRAIQEFEAALEIHAEDWDNCEEH